MANMKKTEQQIALDGVDYGVNPKDLIIKNVVNAGVRDDSYRSIDDIKHSDTFFNNDMAKASKSLDEILSQEINNKSESKDNSNLTIENVDLATSTRLKTINSSKYEPYKYNMNQEPVSIKRGVRENYSDEEIRHTNKILELINL